MWYNYMYMNELFNTNQDDVGMTLNYNVHIQVGDPFSNITM